MKKLILISLIMLFAVNIANAEMKSQTLSIGGDSNSETESAVQTIIRNQIGDVSDQIPPKIEVNETNINYNITPEPYYYPYQPVVYTRTVGPYGVYSNVGGFSFNYQGHGFSYGVGFNSPIYVNRPAPPPPPNHFGGGGHRPGGPGGPGRPGGPGGPGGHGGMGPRR